MGMVRNLALMGVLWSNGLAAADSYDPTTNQLTIPAITIAGKTYSAVVTVGNLLSYNTGIAGAEDSYDVLTNVLTIPSIVVAGTTYTNVKLAIGNLVTASVIPNVPTAMKLFFNAEIIGPKAPGEFQINIRSASSTDGIHFNVDPEIWATSDTLSDPVLYRTKSGKWFIGGLSVGQGIRIGSHQGSPDFTSATISLTITDGQVPGFLEFDTGMRLYYFGDGGILSAFSTDGTTWTKEAGVRVATPAGTNLVLIADPAPARRKNGTIVMYFKAAGPPSANPSPYDHMLYRATSTDGLTFTHENKLLVDHASVPQAFTDATGRVGIYYIDFRNFPKEKESIAAVYEKDDFSLTDPVFVTFDNLPKNTWANDPTPILTR